MAWRARLTAACLAFGLALGVALIPVGPDDQPVWSVAWDLIDDPGPDPSRREILASHVAAIRAMEFQRNADTPVLVFTGSSSIRLWDDIEQAFPGYQVVNSGFGGSTMEDLLQHQGPLIRRFEPDTVYIHSGDNDLAWGRNPDSVLRTAVTLVDGIARDLPDTEVVFIAAKPSLRRWHLRAHYEQLNASLAELAAERDEVSFIDVWQPMLDPVTGEPRREFYVADGLHMSSQGYAVWTGAIAPHLPTHS